MIQCRKKNKITALLLCISILFILVFSEIYIANHIHHHCSGRNCPICHEILIAENHIQKISSGLIGLFTILFAAILLEKRVIAVSVFVPTPSLITEKIRLND